MKPLPRIEGEVQRYQIGPDGDEWVKADDYAALNDYAALVQMERDSARAEVERLREAGVGYSQQTVDAITKERDALRAEVERWQNKWASRPLSVEDTEALERRNDELEAEVERLKTERAQVETVLSHELSKALAEVDRLRADAERWRFIREHRPKGMSLMPGDELEKLIDKGRAAFPTATDSREGT